MGGQASPPPPPRSLQAFGSLLKVQCRTLNEVQCRGVQHARLRSMYTHIYTYVFMHVFIYLLYIYIEREREYRVAALRAVKLVWFELNAFHSRAISGHRG